MGSLISVLSIVLGFVVLFTIYLYFAFRTKEYGYSPSFKKALFELENLITDLADKGKFFTAGKAGEYELAGEVLRFYHNPLPLWGRGTSFAPVDKIAVAAEISIKHFADSASIRYRLWPDGLFEKVAVPTGDYNLSILKKGCGAKVSEEEIKQLILKCVEIKSKART